MTEARRDSNALALRRSSRKTRRRSVAFFALGCGVYAVASFIGLSVWGAPSRQIASASTAVHAIHPIAEHYRGSHGGSCVTALELHTEIKSLPIIDPWGSTYVIRCDGDSTKVLSCGADKKEGTADDIVEGE